ncbi:nucleotide pyrophosphohydrolase [Ligilactobacillus equi]|uniref:Nucleotide pyrophosphohydrolase n=1 Tax=Ligilactobacillus equi DSM 15833 = JCM 10991 TaxID=1423740 RepID=A0A0R1T6C4_9LACO|nr:nucleotide pyrophosphohydrolase [Ligilactobacillus equi]KRL76729.1 hypothetical protein FC36_GL001844 [Ligilactobacillus equi DSM 15833 = JCM 10991]
MDKDIMQELIKFRTDRGWDKYHNLKDLALSVSIEASEILELFQWKPELDYKNIEDLKEEIADTMIYLLYMCDKLNVDPNEIILNKIRKNQK